MRILFVADGRSPIAINWISYFVEAGHEVLLASTYPCRPNLGLASMRVLPLPFSSPGESGGGGSWGARRWLGVGWRTRARQWLVPLTLARVAQPLHEMIEHLKPDLVHAMRIPYEGMTAAAANLEIPLLVSVWGNDFTLHARSSPWMGYWTRRAMQAAQALHTDCQRDQRMAQQWGFQKDRQTLVTPGNGGIDPSIFHQPSEPVLQPVVINPRGFRSYVRNDTFFKSIPIALKQIPQARFLCASMAGEPVVERWIARLGIAHAVQLLPACSHNQMGDIFRSAAVLVSPSIHDGTPNSLLEGMACGCFPVAGRLESLQEWITHGQNGFLVDPDDAQSLADAILAGLTDPGLRARAAAANALIISERAVYDSCMSRVEVLYQEMIDKRS